MTTGAPQRVGAACPGVPGPALEVGKGDQLLPLARVWYLRADRLSQRHQGRMMVDGGIHGQWKIY